MRILRFGSLVVFTIVAVACSSSAQSAAFSPAPVASPSAIARARADSMRYPYTAADIAFMTGMIAHHAQAVQISSWAESHGASPVIQRLTARIINAQRDEIHTMQSWLAARGQPVPDPGQVGTMQHGDHGMTMPGMTMPGMLTADQLMALDAARGKTFDELFLRDMIQHHSGAVEMVDKLFATSGAAQDETTFKFANDVQVDQRTEIARMQGLLADILFDETDP
jgi:uncharacterized protein (DUF305 family)